MICFDWLLNRFKLSFDSISWLEWMNNIVLQANELFANIAGNVAPIGDIWSEFTNALYIDTNEYGVQVKK